MRDATGGDESGLAVLVAIPILWLAVFGTRRDLTAAAVLAALTFVLPVVVVGEPAYSVGEWRQAVLWPGIALVIAPVMLHVVRRLAVESIRSQEIAARFEGIVRGATLSSLVTTDTDGVITTFGVGAEKQTGYRAGEVLGRELTSVCFHRGELETVAEELGVTPDFAVLTRLAHTRAGSRDLGPAACRRGDRVRAHVGHRAARHAGPGDRLPVRGRRRDVRDPGRARAHPGRAALAGPDGPPARHHRDHGRGEDRASPSSPAPASWRGGCATGRVGGCRRSSTGRPAARSTGSCPRRSPVRRCRRSTRWSATPSTSSRPARCRRPRTGARRS